MENKLSKLIQESNILKETSEQNEEMLINDINKYEKQISNINENNKTLAVEIEQQSIKLNCKNLESAVKVYLKNSLPLQKMAFFNIWKLQL